MVRGIKTIFHPILGFFASGAFACSEVLHMAALANSYIISLYTFT